MYIYVYIGLYIYITCAALLVPKVLVQLQRRATHREDMAQRPFSGEEIVRGEEDSWGRRSLCTNSVGDEQREI